MYLQFVVFDQYVFGVTFRRLFRQEFPLLLSENLQFSAQHFNFPNVLLALLDQLRLLVFYLLRYSYYKPIQCFWRETPSKKKKKLDGKRRFFVSIESNFCDLAPLLF